MYLYPRLTLSAAQEIAKQNIALDPAMLRHTHEGNHFVTDESALYAPTGGHRIEPQQLKELRRSVRQCADQLGFPEAPDIETRHNFDALCSILLHQQMKITPSEASSLGVWAHMTCVLLPDIVRWRFRGEETTEDRFIGRARGMGRNTFGRLWWRAYLLYDPMRKDDPFYLLSQFGEDDLVQLTERPSIAGSPRLAKQILISFIEFSQMLHESSNEAEIRDRQLLRDAMKRVRRLLPVVMFEVLDDALIKSLIDKQFMKSIETLVRKVPR